MTKDRTGISKARRTSFSRPTCTHVSLSRLYGAYTCDICDKSSPLGWVYFCDQDIPVHPDPNPIQTWMKPVTYEDHEIVREFQMLGMNRSIINGVRNGDYSEAQITKIRDQKRSVQISILTTECLLNEGRLQGHGSSYTNTSKPALLSSSTKASFKEPKRKKRKKSKVEDPKTPEKCELKVCHRCRPSMRERVFVSFENAFAGKIAPPEHWIKRFMPIRNAATLRNWPMVPLTQFISADDRIIDSRVTHNTVSILSTREHDFQVSNRQMEQSNAFYQLETHRREAAEVSSQCERSESRGFRTSVRKAIEEMLRRTRESSSDGSSLSRLENSSTLTIHDANEERLEDLLYKSMSDKILLEAATIPLPEDNDRMAADGILYEIVHDDGMVEAGVALTEEAASMNAPDVVTQL